MSLTLLKSGSWLDCACNRVAKRAHAATTSKRENRDLCFTETHLSKRAVARFCPGTPISGGSRRTRPLDAQGWAPARGASIIAPNASIMERNTAGFLTLSPLVERGLKCAFSLHILGAVRSQFEPPVESTHFSVLFTSLALALVELLPVAAPFWKVPALRGSISYAGRLAASARTSPFRG